MAKSENKENLNPGVLEILIKKSGLQKGQVGDYKVLEKINNGESVLTRTLDEIWSRLNRYYPQYQRDTLCKLKKEDLENSISNKDFILIVHNDGTPVQLENIFKSKNFMKYFELSVEPFTGFSDGIQKKSYEDKWIVDPNLKISDEEKEIIKSFEKLIKETSASFLQLSDSFEEALAPNDNIRQLSTIKQKLNELGIKIYYREYDSIKTQYEEQINLCVMDKTNLEINDEFGEFSSSISSYDFQTRRDYRDLIQWVFSDEQQYLRIPIGEINYTNPDSEIDAHRDLDPNFARYAYDKYGSFPFFAGNIVKTSEKRIFLVTKHEANNYFIKLDDGHNINFRRLKQHRAFFYEEKNGSKRIVFNFDELTQELFEVDKIEDFFAKYYWYFDISKRRMLIAPKDDPHEGSDVILHVDRDGIIRGSNNLPKYMNLPENWTEKNTMDYYNLKLQKYSDEEDLDE